MLVFQPYQSQGGVGPHLWMLHSICNIDKHRRLNVVNLHSFSTAHLEGEVDPELTHGQTEGVGLLTLFRGTEQEDKVKIDVVVDVCFRDDELEDASVGYGSEIERSGPEAASGCVSTLVLSHSRQDRRSAACWRDPLGHLHGTG